MEDENSIEKIAGKKSPFVVPESYFDEFQKNLMERINEQSQEEVPILSLWEKAKIWLYMAASFLMIAGSLRFFVPKITSMAKENRIENREEVLNQEEQYAYFTALGNDYPVYVLLNEH
ncbi:MAG TPA: hypothetical protein DDY68_04830 [Porphyromonadaceae bacterium]|nr:hypothetical protein [Porphyromonadaceae bacterium]